MPLYMDRHDGLEGVTPAQLALVHAQDVSLQAKYGVRFITYFLDEGPGTGFCLAESPTQKAMEDCHREAHGNVPSRIIEVSWATVQLFLGRITEPLPGEVWQATSVRTLLISEIEDIGGLASRLGDARARLLVQEHDGIVRDAVAVRGGDVQRTGRGLLAAFASAVQAIECSIAIQRQVARRNRRDPAVPLQVRIGLNAGEPVTANDQLFGAAVELADTICGAAGSGRIISSSVVRDLCLGKGFDFTECRPSPFSRDPSVRIYEVTWTEEGGAAKRSYPDGLTAREVEILRLLAIGRTNQQIASELGISQNTVFRHVSHIFTKARLANRAEAASYAHRHSLISDPEM
jgi:class 3 adenylate cyclase